MDSASQLVVPVDIQALVVTRTPQTFRQWRFNYSALASFNSPEPDAGGGQASTQARAAGIYLHWDLPDALRHGTGDVSLSITYPKVPNRWLVVRLTGAGSRTATGWVVESDCPNSASPAMYLVDNTILNAWTTSGDPIRVKGASTTRQSARGGPLVALLGQAFPLAVGWQERAPTATFLTAVAPGNIMFSRYETHCANVFTFYDAMTGVADGDQVTYLVAGWYANPADDILAHATPTDLGWSVAGHPSPSPTSSIYQGLALAVPWHPSSSPPSPLPALAGSVHAGVGTTTVDAFAALVSGQLANPAAVDLFRAFHYGLLPELEAVNGPNRLATAVHQAGFGSRPGALRWEIVTTAGDGAEPAPPTPDEAAWLLALNNAQAELDAAEAILDAHRWSLYALWWKWQKGVKQSVIEPPPGFDPDAYSRAVGQVVPGLLAADTQRVGALRGAVPQPAGQAGDTRQDSFQRGITQFAAAKNLAAGKALKPVAGPRTWRASDPVVVLSGLPSAPPAADATLPCRVGNALVTHLLVGTEQVGAGQLGPATPVLANAGGLPLPLAALLLETFLLDPASATAIATATTLDPSAVAAAITGQAAASYPGQTLPAAGLAAWTEQPWRPLLMEWQVGFVPIPTQTAGTDNWTFDGLDYRYTGPFGPFPADPSAPVQLLGGIAPLTPEAQFTFRSQLQKFITDFVTGNPGAGPDLVALSTLLAAIESIDSWQFMSQALTGFGDLTALRDGRPQTGPDATVAAAVAGRTAGVPWIPNGPVYPFQAVRQGQFAVQLLLVYDTFGQVLQVVGGTGTTDPQNFAPARDAAIVPDKPVITRNPARLVEARPRLMQHSQLDFRFVDAIDDSEPVVTGGPANPVIAWLVPNHLDRGVLLFGADGRALGEVRLLADATGIRTASWQPPPHARMTLADVAAAAPKLAELITAPAFTDALAFGTFLDAIDSTLWSVDPLGDRADQNLSVLIGRPLALVRAGLRLSVDGLPLAELTDWSITWPPPEPAFLARTFSVRLGDQASRQDGLIGFYAGADYATFNSVTPPDASVNQSYVRIIGPIGNPTGGNWLSLSYGAPQPAFVTMLMDPRAAAHAVTGLLPTKAITLPNRFTTPALSSLELTFRIGTLLTHAEASPATGTSPPPYPQSMWLPYPTERNGTWSWWEQEAAQWSPSGLMHATNDARLKDYPNTLRDGFLQFVTDLTDRRELS